MRKPRNQLQEAVTADDLVIGRSLEEHVLGERRDPKNKKQNHQEPNKTHGPHHSASHHHVMHHEMPPDVLTLTLLEMPGRTYARVPHVGVIHMPASPDDDAGYRAARNTTFPTTACCSPGTLAAMVSSQRPGTGRL